MTTMQILELLVAFALIAGAVWLYRRPGEEGARGGSQGAVILLIIGIIVAIHALGLMDYRPIPGEQP